MPVWIGEINAISEDGTVLMEAILSHWLEQDILWSRLLLDIHIQDFCELSAAPQFYREEEENWRNTMWINSEIWLFLHRTAKSAVPAWVYRWSCNKKLYQDFVKTNVGVYISFHSRAELSLSFWAQKYFLSPHIIFLGVESLLVIFCAIWVFRIDWAQ